MIDLTPLEARLLLALAVVLMVAHWAVAARVIRQLRRELEAVRADRLALAEALADAMEPELRRLEGPPPA